MMKLADALDGVSRIGLDTAPIIYFIEAHPKYDSLVTAVFGSIADGNLIGTTSAISLTEVLVHPMRLGRTALCQQYADLLLNSPNVQLLSVTPDIALRAAELRSVYRLRTPDALQVATALAGNCGAFLTNDADLKRVRDPRVLVLDELTL